MQSFIKRLTEFKSGAVKFKAPSPRMPGESLNLADKGKFSLKDKFRAVGAFFERIDAALYPIVGLPDYERYLEHFAHTHPDKKPLSRAEFFREAQDSKAKNIKC